MSCEYSKSEFLFIPLKMHVTKLGLLPGKVFRLFFISNKRENILYSELTATECSLANFLRTSADIQCVDIIEKKEAGNLNWNQFKAACVYIEHLKNTSILVWTGEWLVNGYWKHDWGGSRIILKIIKLWPRGPFIHRYKSLLHSELKGWQISGTGSVLSSAPW